MPDTICVAVCSHYLPEAQSVCAQSSVPRIRVVGLPARCGRPPLAWDEVEALRQRPDEPVVLFGGPCLARLEAVEAQRRGIILHPLRNCLELVVNARLLETFLSQGAYVMTPGWLGDWRGNLARQGRDPGQVRSLWRESITKLVLLDTGVGDPLGDLADMSEHLGLPSEVLPVGLDHVQLLLEREVLERRLRFQGTRAEGSLQVAQRQAADRATAMEFLGTLSQSLRESEVIQGIQDLFTMLFHAADVRYEPRREDAVPPVPEGRAYVETAQGFLVPIGTSLGRLGCLRVEGLAFPQFKPHYLNLALSMTGVCALALQNAQAYRAVEESRAYQRLMLDILDIFYRPGESARDLRAVLDLVREFSRSSALALRLREGDRFLYHHADGYPAGFLEQRCDRCLGAIDGRRGAPAPAGARRSARGSLWFEDLADHPVPCPCGAQGFRSVALVQLRLRGGLEGLLQLHHESPGHFTLPLIERLEGAARSIAIGLERRRAEEDLRRVNRELESRVQQRTAELAAINQELRVEITERTRAEDHLEAQSAELQVRLKELHCLYALSNLFEQHESTVDSLCRQAIDLVPGGWSHPERTSARLRLDDQEFTSPGFREGGTSLSAELAINGVARGSLTVFVEEVGEAPPFLEEERGLIRTMADLVQGLVDHVEIEEEKRKVEQRLVQSQKLEALGTLAGGIAHDFNNALTPIIALTELSLMKLPPDSPIRKHLELVMQSGSRAKGLVEQILLFSRRKTPNLAPVDLAPLVKENLKLIRSTLPATIEIQQDLPEDCGRVLGDPTQIHQILMNLCTNAYHAMQEHGGILRVRLQSVHAWPGDPLLGVELADGDYVRLEVADTGVGMPPDVQARIFEPFFTTKGPGQGTGMGLSVVHGIIASYGGQISLYSEPGRGTTFRIFLPVVRDPAAVPAGPGVPPDLPQGHERILIVDDEEGIRWALSAMLQGLGYRTETAEDGLRALARLEAAPEAFDLVLSDMTMPKLTGLELAQRLHAARPGLPVVLCSGFSDHLQPKNLEEAGIREFVEKPFTVSQVAQALRRELDRAASPS